MKCRFLSALSLVNPAWSEQAQNAVRDAGVPYSVPSQVQVGAGFEVEDPQAWMHCCPGSHNAPPIAEPADDECAEAVRVFMTQTRPLGICAIQAQLDQLDKLTNAEDREAVKNLARSYGLVPTGQSKKAAGTPVV